MGVFSIDHVWADFYDVLLNGERAAILLAGCPGDSAEDNGSPWTIHLDPAAFPDVPARDLPAPLTNDFMAFDTFADAMAFLGIAEMEIAA